MEIPNVEPALVPGPEIDIHSEGWSQIKHVKARIGQQVEQHVQSERSIGDGLTIDWGRGPNHVNPRLLKFNADAWVRIAEWRRERRAIPAVPAPVLIPAWRSYQCFP